VFPTTLSVLFRVHAVIFYDVPSSYYHLKSNCRVRKDISTSLVLRNPHVVVGSFDRHNLFYGVKLCNRSISFVGELVKDVSKRSAVGESTIIYCTTIRETEQVCEFSELYNFLTCKS
jgi:ATP-dependent DNA helicase RecQ